MRPSSRPVFRFVFRSEEGQSLVELSMVIPLLLIIFLGLLEAANAYDRQHVMASLTREGANMASRGAELADVESLVEANGAQIGLGERGGTVVSRVWVDKGTAQVVAQQATPGYLGLSQMGAIGDPVAQFDDLGLVDGHNVHVVEVFFDYEPFTPLGAFVEAAVPEGLYSRAVF